MQSVFLFFPCLTGFSSSFLTSSPNPATYSLGHGEVIFTFLVPPVPPFQSEDSCPESSIDLKCKERVTDSEEDEPYLKVATCLFEVNLTTIGIMGLIIISPFTLLALKTDSY